MTFKFNKIMFAVSTIMEIIGASFFLLIAVMNRKQIKEKQKKNC